MHKIGVILAAVLAGAGTVAMATTPSGGGGAMTGGGGSVASAGGGGGGSHGGGGGSSSGGSGAHGSGGGYSSGGSGGHGYGGGTHSAAAAAGWHSGAASDIRGSASGAPSAPPKVTAWHSHAAARAIEAANLRPHPPRPKLPPRPAGSNRPQYVHVAHTRLCNGNLDCALWSRADLYCAAYPSDYLPTAEESRRCPRPRRTQIDQRTGLPVP